MQRTLMSLIVGASALSLAPAVAHADPRDSRRTVYVYDGHDVYREARRAVRRVFVPSQRRARRTYTPPPQPVYAPPERCAEPALLPERRAGWIVQQLQRYRNHPRTQLRVLADNTRGYLLTLEQVLCLTEQVCASPDRVEALVLLYPSLDDRCCLDYVGRTQHLLGHCDREPFACRIAALRPPCTHGGRHGGPVPAARVAHHAPAPERVVVVNRRGRR